MDMGNRLLLGGGGRGGGGHARSFYASGSCAKEETKEDLVVQQGGLPLANIQETSIIIVQSVRHSEEAHLG